MSRPIKPVIYVFWEGESEAAYSKYLKKTLEDRAIIKNYSSGGLFSTAIGAFANEPKYRNSINATDEIWFFFDVESRSASKWRDNIKAIKKLRRLRSTGVKVRLLMTKACIEYWLLLHYEQIAPPIESTADKDKILNRVLLHEPSYSKGNESAISAIATHYPEAIPRGRWTLQLLKDEGLPAIEDSDMRNEWLHQARHTFTTVHEAIEYVISLPKI